MKKFIPIVLAVMVSLIITLITSEANQNQNPQQISNQAELDGAVFKQEVVNVFNQPQMITKIYEGSRLLGVLTDEQIVDSVLVQTYNDQYVEDFPGSKIGLGEDVYLSVELSYFEYNNVDDLIVEYLQTNDLFSVEVYKIEFSNGAVIYVKDLAEFETAKELYLLNFISKSAYDDIKNKREIPKLTTYGSIDTGINVLESTSITKGLASRNKILKNQNEIIYFLSYGYDTEIKTYTVAPFDTVEGVGYKTGLSAQQLITINNQKLKTTDQVLEPGLQLNVTYFNSPISVVVTRDRLTKEIVYPSNTKYVADPSIREGISRVITREVDGSKNVLYKETYVNGVLIKGEVISESITKQPIQEVVAFGTKVIPGIGSGKFRWPINNPSVSCGWFCYSGHRAIDIQNRYDRYGSIYAADRGVVTKRAYSSIGGYYLIIDHNNGYRTYYGHMASPGYFPEGVAVEKGEAIGRIGMTGRTTGPHTHFQVWQNGTLINPCRVLGC
ncbi:MAG: peptidoglycan DD-metalloendopeptidase family protein [Erysipelotrichaceae bacterium]|nr:peptidoglycan DD-metalloendopeptidase family protein [Erysipelotrichaceae bacterium]MDP3305273.1 peptidoglycan DD-metalloendopeptidase family protein [Erysipelotrichaceae bacterium]